MEAKASAGADRELILRYSQQGDRDALAALYDHYALDIHTHLSLICADSHVVEEALQRLFLKLMRNPGQFASTRNFREYFFKSARYEVFGILREGNRRKALLESSLTEQRNALDVSNPGGDSEESESVNRRLSILPPEQREVVFLKIVRDMTFQEIGVTLEISPKTAASRYEYALEKLRRQQPEDENT